MSSSSKQPLQVLLIEDVEDDRFIIEDHLLNAEYEQFALTWVDEKDKAIEEIKTDKYDVVLLDHDLVGFTGMDILQEMRVKHGYRKAMIFLSGSKDPRIRTEALDKGASGFLIKDDMTSSMLELSILFAIERSKNLISLEKLVDERTAELKATINAMEKLNQELKEAQSELVEKETLANLGGLVSGVAHEINTPIGIGVTVASHLQDKTDAIFSSFSSGSITEKQLTDYLGIAKESSEIILKNLGRAAELIQSFKRMSVDQAGHNQRKFKLIECIQDVVTSMQPQLKNTKIDLDIHCDDSIELNSFPGIYSQILTNLISNSLIHGFENTKEGRIEINAYQSGEKLTLQYNDNGVGMDPETLSKIFIPFFTTKRNEGGSGLGSSIIFNCVKQLHGNIQVDSKPGEGVHYNILMPLTNQQQQ